VRVLSGPPVRGAAVVRAVALSLVITLVTAAAHATHGHPPSWPLAAVTVVILAAAALGVCRTRLGWTRAIAAMVIGQFALHAWFAWFSLPTAGDGVSTLALHHGPAASTLVARDFSALVPSPGMAAAHIVSAGLLALLLVNADWLLSAAVAILGGTIRTYAVPASPFPHRVATPLFDRPEAPSVPLGLSDVLVRRGPPAYCV